MIRQPVSSSNLQSVGYDPSSGVLEIAFHDGAVYQYSHVPSTVHQELISADSKDQYYYQHINENYGYRKVE